MSLLDIHRSIDEIYREHLMALISLEWEKASGLLQEFQRKISQHAQDEEAFLRSIYVPRAGKIPGGDPELFFAEHRRMLDFVRWLQEDLQSIPGHLSGQEGLDPDARREALARVIAILEREFRLKHLLEHHDLRERNILYPVMDRITTPEEKACILGSLEG